MTWKLKVRSNPGSLVTADYECPVHGVFTQAIERDESGDPPEWIHCYKVGEPSLYVSDGEGGAMVVPGTDERCVEACRHVMTAPASVSVRRGEVVRGRSDARPSDRYVCNTEKLADGMPLAEWKAERAAVHRDESLRRVRAASGKTPKVYR